MRRMTVLGALAAPTVRTVRRGPLLAALVTGFALVAIPAAMTVSLRADDLAALLRIACVCAGIGLAFLLDDPAKPTVSTVPVPAWLSVLIRSVVGTVVAAAWWTAAVVATLAGAAPGVGELLPIGALTLEAGAIGAVAFTLAVLAWRRAPRGTGSTVGVPAVLLLMTGLALLPDRFALVVSVDDPRWRSVHLSWGALLAAAVLVGALAAAAPRLPIDRTG